MIRLAGQLPFPHESVLGVLDVPRMDETKLTENSRGCAFVRERLRADAKRGVRGSSKYDQSAGHPRGHPAALFSGEREIRNLDRTLARGVLKAQVPTTTPASTPRYPIQGDTKADS